MEDIMRWDVHLSQLQDGALAQVASHGWNGGTISNGRPEDAQSGAVRSTFIVSERYVSLWSVFVNQQVALSDDVC